MLRLPKRCAYQCRLTASNFGVASGLSQYATPGSFWEKLTGRVREGKRTEFQAAVTSRGNRLEGGVRSAHERERVGECE